MMQQKIAAEELEFRLRREEHEEMRCEREEERREREEERHWHEEERYEDRCHREDEPLELRRKESQQQQQTTMMMQLGMTAMMAFFGMKVPKPDDK